MYFVLTFMMIAAVLVVFLCGYYLAIIKQKIGRNWLYAIPITVAILMFNVIWALMEMGKSGRW